MSKSPLRYPGGKSKISILGKIIARMPKKYDEFRSCFVGGGGLFFHLPAKGRRWINDIHPGLIAFYKALKYRPTRFIEECRKIEPAKEEEPLVAAKNGKKLYNKRLKEIFDKFKGDEEMDQALRYFFINRTVWMGRVNYKISSRMYFSNPQGWNIVNTNILKKAAKHLKSAVITKFCATGLLKAPGKNIFCYCDPPYLSDTQQPRASQLYEYAFEREDHEKLAEAVKKSEHKVLLSYDDDESGFIRSLYLPEDGFYIYEDEWTYCGSSSAEGQSETKKVGKELLITNYYIEEDDDVVKMF